MCVDSAHTNVSNVEAKLLVWEVCHEGAKLYRQQNYIAVTDTPIKHSLKLRFQMSSELKAAWTNLVVLNVEKYFSFISVARVLTHLAISVSRRYPEWQMKYLLECITTAWWTGALRKSSKC